MTISRIRVPKSQNKVFILLSLTWAEERRVVDDLLVAWTALFGADLDSVHVFGPSHAAVELQYGA